METTPAPGLVLDLAQHGDEVYVLVRMDGPTRPPNARVFRYAGGRFEPTALEAPAPATAFVDGPHGPWVALGRRLESLWSFQRRDLGVEGKVALAGSDPVIASDGGVLRRLGAWETTISPPDRIAYPGIVQLRRDTSWQPEPKPPWTPRQWAPGKAPIVTGGLVVATFCEWSSGIGIAVGCDLVDGRVLWRTEPGPIADISVYAEGEVVIGSQGYGAFSSELRDASPHVRATWPTQGIGIPLGDGLVILEMDNANTGRCRVMRIHRRGVVEQGPVLPGYYTSRPARLGDGFVFARGDGLWRVGADLGVERLATLPGDESWYKRTLVLSDGTVIFSSDRVHAVRTPATIDAAMCARSPV